MGGSSPPMIRNLWNLVRTRALRSLQTWPDSKGWRDCLVAFVLFSAFAIPTGFVTQFFSFQPSAMPPLKFLGVMAILFVFPGIAEELMFRGLVLPHRSEQWSPARLRIALGVSVVAHRVRQLFEDDDNADGRHHALDDGVREVMAKRAGSKHAE